MGTEYARFSKSFYLNIYLAVQILKRGLIRPAFEHSSITWSQLQLVKPLPRLSSTL